MRFFDELFHEDHTNPVQAIVVLDPLPPSMFLNEVCDTYVSLWLLLIAATTSGREACSYPHSKHAVRVNIGVLRLAGRARSVCCYCCCPSSTTALSPSACVLHVSGQGGGGLRAALAHARCPLPPPSPQALGDEEFAKRVTFIQGSPLMPKVRGRAWSHGCVMLPVEPPVSPQLVTHTG
jgi:hypothetical protein